MNNNLNQEKHLENLEKVLDFVADAFEKENVTWLLGGSGALWIWGIKVIPKDLDILVNPQDLQKLGNLFQEYITSPIQSYENFGRKYSIFKIEIFGVQVEISGLEFDNKELAEVEFNGRKYLVNSLKKELGFYQKRPGKEEKIELIKQKIHELSRRAGRGN